MATGQNGKTPTTSSHMSNASKILEKKSANIHHMRRSTPDSEALASSDDDHDQNPMSQSAHSTHSTQSATFAKPARRASWLSEVQAGSQQRKFSVGSASNVQPGSGPTTPAGESGPSAWGVGSGMMRPSPWSGAWQKEPPARLMEDVPYEGYMGRYPLDDEPLVSPTSYQHPGDENDGSFPFPIPMQPVRKTFRSQSYSVGQMEAEANAAGAQAAANPPTMAAHPRSGVTGLPHRPSRPSMLGENSVGGGRPILGQLLEDEDDHDHPHSPVNYSAANLPRTNLGKSDQASNIPNASSALLKQAAVENARARQKTSSNIGLGGSVDSYARFRLSQPTYTNIPAQPAIDDMNEEQDYGDGRRPEAKKALWQTSLGFGPVDEGSQSRRHSFADVPPRSRTISSSLLSPRSHEGLGPSASVQHDTAVVDDRKSTFRPRSNTHPLEIKPPMSASSSSVHPLARIVEEEPRNPLARVVEEEIEKQHDFDRAFAALYFHGVIPSLRAQQTAAETQASASYRDAPHPSMNPFAVPSVITNPQPDLYLVTFKCARAEVYYIPANTGLQVKMGDMVVVEGDRGIDLGTVSHARVSMAEAKALKEAATDQHFNWLMMFSRTMQAVTGTTPSTGLLANSNGDRPSAVGGMGPRVPLPSSGQSPHADHDIRPKMIRRLAQNHEIQMLRDKEGAEAKAKRVCQSKVSDHGLNMEILDAEFQFDWKKLTYFYFAESYVNFNELVTDLFKVYKTRIWMSAINPASFASPISMLGHAGSLAHAGANTSVSPVGSRDRGLNRPTSREPVVHGDDPGQRFVPYQMYGQAQAAPAAAPPMPFNAAWTPTPAPPLPPLNPAYGSPDTPYANYSPAMQPGPLTQYFYGRGGPGGPYTESGATLRPEDMADQFQNMSFGAHQH